MTKLFVETKKLAFDKLKVINQNSGFLTSPTVLNGFLVHHASDLLKGNKGKNFPALTVQYFKDTNGQQPGALVSKCNRELHIFGAVDAKDPDTVNDKLDDLLFDVKCAICNTNSNLMITDVDYSLPEGGEPYAIFRVSVSVKVTENIGLTND
jgi:hypothetical protein